MPQVVTCFLCMSWGRTLSEVGRAGIEACRQVSRTSWISQFENNQVESCVLLLAHIYTCCCWQSHRRVSGLSCWQTVSQSRMEWAMYDASSMPAFHAPIYNLACPASSPFQSFASKGTYPSAFGGSHKKMSALPSGTSVPTKLGSTPSFRNGTLFCL